MLWENDCIGNSISWITWLYSAIVSKWKQKRSKKQWKKTWPLGWIFFSLALLIPVMQTYVECGMPTPKLPMRNEMPEFKCEIIQLPVYGLNYWITYLLMDLFLGLHEYPGLQDSFRRKLRPVSQVYRALKLLKVQSINDAGSMPLVNRLQTQACRRLFTNYTPLQELN